MKDTLFIPQILNVGYQNRTDTYTGKLAYIVYTDQKGVIRKETSWQHWCDEKIDKDVFKNEATSGFVLNRDVGGVRQSYGWDARLEKVRVYDPRGFEFEIGIPNLLFILQECSAIKGKGLEGEFVYAWDGPSLVLLPVTSQEYQESVKFTTLQSEHVKKKELREGFSYLTKDKKNVVYLGEHIWYGTPSAYHWKEMGKKKLVFALLNGEDRGKRYYEDKGLHKMESDYLVITDPKKIARCTSTSSLPLYPEIYETLTKETPFVSKSTKLVLVKGENTKAPYGWSHMEVAFMDGDKICKGHLNKVGSAWGIHSREVVKLDQNGKFISEGFPQKPYTGYSYYDNYYYNYWRENLTEEEVKDICHSLVIETENGHRTKIITFVKGDLENVSKE